MDHESAKAILNENAAKLPRASPSPASRAYSSSVATTVHKAARRSLRRRLSSVNENNFHLQNEHAVTMVHLIACRLGQLRLIPFPPRQILIISLRILTPVQPTPQPLRPQSKQSLSHLRIPGKRMLLMAKWYACPVVPLGTVPCPQNTFFMRGSRRVKI